MQPVLGDGIPWQSAKQKQITRNAITIECVRACEVVGDLDLNARHARV